MRIWLTRILVLLTFSVFVQVAESAESDQAEDFLSVKARATG